MKRLKHEPNMLAAKCRPAILVEFREIGAGDQHAAGARRVESREQRQQGRLARARLADDGQSLAGSHTEAHIGENGQRPRGAGDRLRYILGFENDLILHQERL